MAGSSSCGGARAGAQVLEAPAQTVPCNGLSKPNPTCLLLQGFLALFAGDTGEIRHEVREQIDAKVRSSGATDPALPGHHLNQHIPCWPQVDVLWAGLPDT